MINLVTIDGASMVLPTKKDIADLAVGDIAPSSLGESKVTEILARGKNVHGKTFVCYYVALGNVGASLSHTLTEGMIDWPIDDRHSYAKRCAFRAKLEPGPLRDCWGYLINSMGQRI